MNKNFRNKLKIIVNVGGTKNKENNIQQLLTPFWKKLKITNKRNLKNKHSSKNKYTTEILNTQNDRIKYSLFSTWRLFTIC